MYFHSLNFKELKEKEELKVIIERCWSILWWSNVIFEYKVCKNQKHIIKRRKRLKRVT